MRMLRQRWIGIVTEFQQNQRGQRLRRPGRSGRLDFSDPAAGSLVMVNSGVRIVILPDPVYVRVVRTRKHTVTYVIAMTTSMPPSTKPLWRPASAETSGDVSVVHPAHCWSFTFAPRRSPHDVERMFALEHMFRPHAPREKSDQEFWQIDGSGRSLVLAIETHGITERTYRGCHAQVDRHRQAVLWTVLGGYAGHLTHSRPGTSSRRSCPVSMTERVDGDHFELPTDAVELLRQVRPGDRQRFIDEVTAALAGAATIRLQRQPDYEGMIQRMRRRERRVPVDPDALQNHRG